jgi:hypothetical protein
MKLHNKKIEFLTFNDGTARIYPTDDNDEPIAGNGKAYRFGNRKVGVTRYYAARQDDTELNRLIHVHYDTGITTQHAVVINKTRYKIEQVQHDDATNPRCTILSLSQRGLWEGATDIDSE